MAIFGESSDDYIDDANKSLQQGYNEAAGYESPYTTYGGQDFDSARNYLYKSLSSRQDVNSQWMKYLDMSPDELLDEALSNYSMSPEAQAEETFAMDSANNAATAAGMGGSGNNYAKDAELGNAIGMQDESRYLNQLMSDLGVQSQITKGYDKQTKQLMDYFQDMLGTEEKAANTMAGVAQRTASGEAMADERGAINNRNQAPIKEIASLGSAIAGLLMKPKTVPVQVIK